MSRALSVCWIVSSLAVLSCASSPAPSPDEARDADAPAFDDALDGAPSADDDAPSGTGRHYPDARDDDARSTPPTPTSGTCSACVPSSSDAIDVACPDDPCFTTKGTDGAGRSSLSVVDAFDGACGTIDVKNGGAGKTMAWALDFELPPGAKLDHLWNGAATITSGHVHVEPAGFITPIAAGAIRQLGYCASARATSVHVVDRTPPPPGTCDGSEPHLDAASMPKTGELRIGQAMLTGVWNAKEPFCPQLVRLSWAMALAHASRLDALYGIAMTPNQFLATAIKESHLGCDPGAAPCLDHFESTHHDGCFQIECNSAYLQLRQTYGARFDARACDVISGARFETSALTKAFYDRFTWAMLAHKGADPAGFFATAKDPLALPKLFAFAYNRGVWDKGLLDDFGARRATCASTPSLTNDGDDQNLTTTPCVPDSAVHDYVWSVGRYTRALDDPSAPVFDARVRFSDVTRYLDRIAPLYPEVDACPKVRAALSAKFVALAGSIDGTLSFRTQFGELLDVLLQTLPTPLDPAPMVAATY